MFATCETQKQHLQDFSMGFGAGHQCEIQLVLIVWNVITVNSLPACLFGCWNVHQRPAHSIFHQLPPGHFLEQNTLLTSLLLVQGAEAPMGD